MNPKNNLTFDENRGNMPVGGMLENLDNRTSALPTVQMPFTAIASNGCELRLFFGEGRDESIRHEVARMLLESVLKEEKRR